VLVAFGEQTGADRSRRTRVCAYRPEGISWRLMRKNQFVTPWIVGCFVVAGLPLLASAAQEAPPPSMNWTAVARSDRNSMLAHEQLLEKARSGRIDLYFEGDSIVRRWGATDYPELLAHWKESFFGWNAADFGWGADRIQNILWRLENGELDGVDPKVIVLLAGTNNLPDGVGAGEIARGLSAIVRLMQTKAPQATIVVTGIFPRNDNQSYGPVIREVNASLSKMADGRRVRYLDINGRLADGSGQLHEGMMNARDRLHPTLQGYRVWAEALQPLLRELLGPPSKEDHAPPPTGDPSAAR
jgi:lysophospholipase L1-like esterase